MVQQPNQQVADIVRLANTATGVLNYLGHVMTLELHETGSVGAESTAAVESAAALLAIADANLQLLQVDLRPFYN
jgi:hypothetical protein